MTLATLSFFCRRSTILAILEFASSITIEEESCESFSDSSSAVGVTRDISSEDPTDNLQSTSIEEPVVKGLLGKGKSRIIFNLTLNMAHAQILLMNENETKFASLSQENLRTDIKVCLSCFAVLPNLTLVLIFYSFPFLFSITAFFLVETQLPVFELDVYCFNIKTSFCLKVFPSSFSINAALGNLRISDDSLPSNHMYFWICDMRDPGGTSFVEVFNFAIFY